MATPPFRVKAVYDYSSPHGDDLSFPNGQIITVTEQEDTDWYIGEYTDSSGVKQQGLFPTNFVERFEPEAPPRPTRARSKREPLPVAESQPVVPALRQPEVFAEAKGPISAGPPAASDEPSISVPAAQKRESVPDPKPQASKPAPPSKPLAPAVAEKPNSFKDRIAAFNKSSAPPLAPVKPGTLPSAGGFVKKPFVAPPPARNSYVPPPRDTVPVQKIYRREEDPEIVERQAQDQEDAEKAGFKTSEGTATEDADGTEDVPKPTSLKDRIALLQKQQQEQAARRAELTQREQPSRPQHQRTESSKSIAQENHDMGAELERTRSPESMTRRSVDMPREYPKAPTARQMSRGSRPSELLDRKISSGENDADQSGAGDTAEETDGDSTEVEDNRDKPISMPPAAPARASTVSSHNSVDQHTDDGEHRGDEQDEDKRVEEHEMDVETRRKLELRERMAKMSGGMGMAGMFGPPGAMPMHGSAPKKRQSSGTSEPRPSAELGGAPSSPQTQWMPTLPMPDTQRGPARRSENANLEVAKEPEHQPSMTSQRDSTEVPGAEGIEPRPFRSSYFQGRVASPPMHPERSLPPAQPIVYRGPAPPLPYERRVPPPQEPRPVPVQPPRAPQLPNLDFDDGRTPLQTRVPTQPVPMGERDMPIRQATLPPHGVPNLPQRPEGPRSPPMASSKRTSYMESSPPMTSSPTPTAEKRTSRLPPPIPMASPSLPLPNEERGPPPPPPSAASPIRHFVGRGPLGIMTEQPYHGESDYEGDYDTDIASGASHKHVLNSHARESSLDEGNFSEDASLRSPIGAPPPLPSTGQRLPPPSPPHHAPKSRLSMDAPRAPPPGPPPREHDPRPGDDDYDPYRYTGPTHGLPPDRGDRSSSGPLVQESDPSLYSPSPPQRLTERVPQLPQEPLLQQRALAPPTPPQHYRSPQTLAASRISQDISRQSQDVARSSPSISRRSVDQSRPSTDQGPIARDIDLGESTQWWAKHNTLPPVFQTRNDILCEFEESTSSKRGGRTQISKDVYVLFHDYSQTVITARFDSKDVSDAALEQRHEFPPPHPQQDQLEDAHRRYGDVIGAAAAAHHNQTIGDGSAQALVFDLIRNTPTALLPVGTRAYGALVYANMANATVQQYDEIRPGDIIVFRNAKFQGKHGTMHAKYSMDIGKPGHVGVVMDWDGTKKKVRAWEQGRDGVKKVKMESFRIGDLRSGEVKVWRVMGRGWVGWEGGL